MKALIIFPLASQLTVCSSDLIVGHGRALWLHIFFPNQIKDMLILIFVSVEIRKVGEVYIVKTLYFLMTMSPEIHFSLN